MKKTLPISLTLILSLLLITTQALAGPANVTSAKGRPPGTPGPHETPGAQATAHAGLHGKPRIFRGTIATVGSTSLTLTPADGSPAVTVGLTPDTRIIIAGPKSPSSGLQIGMKVMVMAFTDPSTNSLVARMVLAIPGQPTRVHRVGWVTAYSAGSSITILASDGNPYTFTLTTDTKILPANSQVKVGSRVTIIAPRVPSAFGWTATGIVVHPEGSGTGSQPAATPTP